jgi:plastocyanin
MRHIAMLLATLLLPAAAAAQSLVERSPNLQGVWTLPGGQAAFLFAHRFEVLSGGDELRNIPTLTAAAGLPLGFTLGVDYTSNSEIALASVGANEAEYWLKRAVSVSRSAAVAALIGYNSVAKSVDAAADARIGTGMFSLLGELRAYSDAFGAGDGAVAGAVGGVVRLTPYLGVTGDVGRMLSTDTLGTVWSAALAVAIPGTPHTFSFQAANNGATTLHGVSRVPEGALKSVRYGFTFTVPLGTASQWSRIFRPAPAAAARLASDTVGARVDMRQIAFTPMEIRIRAGQRVEWINSDPTVHTVTADDGSWGSELIQEGGRYSRVFETPGRYPYHCVPHPMMKGSVIVEGG